jgi:hypothetical protein
MTPFDAEVLRLTEQIRGGGDLPEFHEINCLLALRHDMHAHNTISALQRELRDQEARRRGQGTT